MKALFGTGNVVVRKAGMEQKHNLEFYIRSWSAGLAGCELRQPSRVRGWRSLAESRLAGVMIVDIRWR